MEFDPEVHMSKREANRKIAEALASADKATEALGKLEQRVTAMEADQAKALDAERAKTKAAEDKAEQAAQDALATTRKAVLMSRGVKDPIDQEDVLTAHQRRGGEASLEEWLDGKGSEDRAVARILAQTASTKTETPADTKTETPADSKEGTMNPPNSNSGARGTQTTGAEPKVLDNLANMRTVAELRENRSAYLQEYMGPGYSAPATSGQALSLAAQAAALQGSKQQ